MVEQNLRLPIYETIKLQGDFMGDQSKDQDVLSFLLRIFPLRSMESEDPRFKNAYDDAFQHLVNNDDWDIDYTFLTRFKIIESAYFEKFVETVVNPEVRVNLEQIEKYVKAINKILERGDYSLIIVDYLNELPVYKIGEKRNDQNRPLEITINRIPFFKSFGLANIFPCFVLFWDRWDDYHYKTTFNVNFYKTINDAINVGKIKILDRNAQNTNETLPDNFTELIQNFCSLGQTKDYYFNLQKLFPANYQSILLALRDVAVFPKIHELFEREEGFKKSLIRDNSVEQIRRTIRYELIGESTDVSKFSYIFKPPYGEDDEQVNLFFDLQKSSSSLQRIIAIIGKNGTGKTTILNAMINDFRKQNPQNVVPKKPVFSKYFTVSYSAFDKFEIPKPDIEFNYVYCGLKKDADHFKTLSELTTEFLQAAEHIKERELEYQWFQVLYSFLSTEHLLKMFPNYENDTVVAEARFEAKNFSNLVTQFSSGESIVLFVLTKIISEIREDSLILYDEPETHLHPNAVSDLMNSLHQLTMRFNSFCIIATHSPLILREIRGKNVIVLKRNGTGLEVSPLSIDSFGENLTAITEEIFGNKEVNKLFLEQIRTLVQKGKNFDEIIDILKSGQLPINLNIRLYIQSLIDNA